MITNPVELHDPAGLDYGNVFQLRTYIVHHSMEKLVALGQVIAKYWPERPPVQTLLGVASLALPEMSFEVDAVAVRR